jgi:hypothetical protein
MLLTALTGVKSTDGSSTTYTHHCMQPANNILDNTEFQNCPCTDKLPYYKHYYKIWLNKCITLVDYLYEVSLPKLSYIMKVIYSLKLLK